MFDTEFVERLAQELFPQLAALLYPRLKTEGLPHQEWFTRKQAAHYIGVTTEALRAMLREGIFPVYQVKGRAGIQRADIDLVWLDNRQYLS
jgi:hypothetical protein